MGRSFASASFAVLALVTWAGGCRQAETTVGFPVRSPEPGSLAESLERDRQELDGFVLGPATQKVVELLARFNQIAVLPGRQESEIDPALSDVRVALRRCLEEPDPQKTLRRLGLWLLARFEEELQALLAIRVAGAPPALLTGALPPNAAMERYAKFVEVGGDFLPAAAVNGLIVQDGDDGIRLEKGSEFFIRLAFKVRWANLMPESTRPHQWLLSDFERRWYYIWVVERSKTATLERQLQAISDLKGLDPAYPEKRARGVLLYLNQRYAEALQAFEEALKEKPEDGQLKSFGDQARRRAR